MYWNPIFVGPDDRVAIPDSSGFRQTDVFFSGGGCNLEMATPTACWINGGGGQRLREFASFRQRYSCLEVRNAQALLHADKVSVHTA